MNQLRLTVPAFPCSDLFDKTWRSAASIHRVKKHQVREMVEHRHYLGCFPAVTPLVLEMRVHDLPMGVIVFAYPPRETFTRYGGLCWELARLWVDDRVPKNGETWFIGQAVKYIRRNFREVDVLVSYADPSAGHAGTIYRAANWTFDGMTDGERKTPRFDYMANGKRYQRRAHVPDGAEVHRVPRVSKHRFYYRIR